MLYPVFTKTVFGIQFSTVNKEFFFNPKHEPMVFPVIAFLIVFIVVIIVSHLLRKLKTKGIRVDDIALRL